MNLVIGNNMDYEMLDYFARIARALGETLIYKVLSSPDEYTDDDILEVFGKFGFEY